MKTIFKISTVLFVGLTLLVSSCKKEEVLIDGCTDINAMNYQDLATSNDGSCEYAYDNAQGLWNISSECDDLVISIPLIGDFPVPLNDWLGGKFRKYTKNILLSRVAKNRKIYNIDNIKKILDSDKLREDHGFAMKIWMLVNLELFIREYFDE